MRLMVLVKATTQSETGAMPDTELLTAMGAYNDELISAGVMVSGEGLKASSAGKRMVLDGATRTVVDGPFAETSELVAGFWMWEVKDMEEAVGWAKRCPNTSDGRSELELRPVFGKEDFGEAMTPELADQEDQRRAKTEGR